MPTLTPTAWRIPPLRAAWVAVRAVTLVCAGALSGGLAIAQPVSLGNGVLLTETEQAYVAAHSPVTYCVDPDWWPFEVIDQLGQHVGIGADLLALTAQRVALPLQLHLTRTWEESLLASKAGKCQLMSFLNRTPDREQWLIFTEPLLIDPNVLITREEAPLITDLAALQGKTMALPTGTAMQERLQRDFPALTIIQTSSETEAMRLVSERKADMTLRSLTVASHTIKKEGWFNLKIAGQVPGYDNLLRIGVRKSEVTLRNLLNKGVATLTAQDRSRAIEKQVEIKAVTAVVTDYTLVKWLATLMAVAGVTSLWWMRKLNVLNAKLKHLSVTDELTGLTNRHGLDRAFQAELERVRRYQRPMTVILLDIDHFKTVNDDMGHLMGDKVLVDFARLLQAAARQVDTVCRFGGEEFLIICHETPPDQALELAERVLAAVRRHAFACGRPITASAGVASAVDGDTVVSLEARADAALYQAKSTGRDRVCLAPAPTAITMPAGSAAT
ncbi:MAG: diguanylate cyclase [Burkholderiales bacterium]|nr:diguanylate cyclase [Burkholderiales bacterium]